MQSLSAAAGEPEHHHRHHRHSWHEDLEDHQSLDGDQVPVSTSTQRPVSAATGDMCPVPGPARRLVPGAGLAADTPADFYTGAESRVQQRSPVTREEGGGLGGPLLTGHEDLSRTLVFHFFVRMTALVYTVHGLAVC